MSSQRLIPLSLIQDAKEWIKEINATDEDVNLREIFRELKEDYSSQIPMNKFKHRVINRQSIKYRGWFTYLQIALTILGIIVIMYKITSFCATFVFPCIKRLFPRTIRRKKDRIRQYRVARQPHQNIELRQRVRQSAPSAPSLLSNL